MAYLDPTSNRASSLAGDLRPVSNEPSFASEVFKPASNGFIFLCQALYNLEGVASESQKVQAEHVDLIAEKTSEANNKMIQADDEQMGKMPQPGEENYAEKVQGWQTLYNLINTRGQMGVNKLQTETQNDGTMLQAIGNFIQNAIRIQTSALSPLQTSASLLQNPV